MLMTFHNLMHKFVKQV